MGMECRYLEWEVRSDTRAKASSQKMLIALQKAVVFGHCGAPELAVTQQDLSGRQVSPAALRKGAGG